MQPGRYRHRRGSRAPGAGGRRAPVGRAAAGRTRSRRDRGSGGRGRRAGRSAPGGGRGPRPRAEGSQRGWLQPESKRRRGGGGGVGREAAEGVPPEKRRGVQLLPGHCGQHSPGNRSGSGQGKGGQRRAGHCTWPLCGWTRPGRVSGRRWRRPLPFSPSPWRTSPGLPMCPPPTHSSFPSGWQTHQTATQAAGVGGVGEVCSVGVLFPSKGTAWGRGELWAGERPPFPQGMLPSQP